VTKSVLILGSSGFLGHSLTFHLSGFDGLDLRGASRTVHSPSQVALANYSEKEVRRALGISRPEFVINCVGLVGHQIVEENPLLAVQLNSEFPSMLSQLSLEYGFHLIHISTDAVYDSAKLDYMHRESDALKPFSLYGSTKLEGELGSLNESNQVSIFRVNFFGPSPSGNRGIFDYFRNGLSEARTIAGYDRYLTSSAYVGELADAFRRVFDLPVPGIFNLGSADSLSKYDFGRLLAKKMGFSPEQIMKQNPSSWVNEGVEFRNLSMDTGKVREVFGIDMSRQSDAVDRALSDLPRFLENADTAYPERSD
jgi:dTDP-4-dehydrorhamnose reductase